MKNQILNNLMVDGTIGMVEKGDMVDCILNGTQIFTGVFNSEGNFQVNNTMPADYNPGGRQK